MLFFQDSVSWGYSNEAFKRLRKITSLPNISETKKDKPYPDITLPTTSTTKTYNFSNATPSAITTVASPVLNLTTTGKTYSLVSTNSPNSPGNILLITTNANMLSGSQTTMMPPLTSPKLSVSIYSKYIQFFM